MLNLAGLLNASMRLYLLSLALYLARPFSGVTELLSLYPLGKIALYLRSGCMHFSSALTPAGRPQMSYVQNETGSSLAES